jgi:hypothetical protein
MEDPDDGSIQADTWPRCDCGYQCRGETSEDRALDAQRHALQEHGIEVSLDQVLKQARTP